MEAGTSIYKKLVIREIYEPFEGFKVFLFEDNAEITYSSGQYLTLVYRINNEEIRRSYSIISSPLLHEPLAIGVKRIENGYLSRELVDHARPGNVLLTTGAGGLFQLPRDGQHMKQLFFFAAGSGVTPVYSLIKTALHVYPGIPVTLIYSNASPQKTLFREELLSLEQQFPNLHTEFLFSNSPDLLRARLYRERIDNFLDIYLKVPYTDAYFYICGPESYMRLCTYVLQEHKVPKDHIKKENFVIDKAKRLHAVPPDKTAHRVTIQYENVKYEVDVQYPDTILQAAKKKGILLPYSCETGRCGNCVARCLEGRIWLSYNEVLTESEIASGLTLTCVGHPVGGDAVLYI